MAAQVKDATGGNDAARIALHTIVSGALASAQGANPGAAAAGGFVAAASSDALALAFYGKKASDLVGDEKMLISNLVTILGSAAGGIAGGDGQSIASGGNAARVEVENNSLSGRDKASLEEAKRRYQNGDESAQAEIVELTKKKLDDDAKVILACSGTAAGSAACSQARGEQALLLLSYEDGPYNSKYKDAYQEEYLHIQQLLEYTSTKTQDQLVIRDSVAKSLAETDGITLQEAYKKYDNYTTTRDVIALVGGTYGTLGALSKIPSPQSINYKVQDLSKVSDSALNIDKVRLATQDYLKSSYQDKAVSYATASVTVNGKTEYYLSVSGKAWSGYAPTTVNIGGVNYKVVITDSKSVLSVPSSATQTNYNHAEQKLFSHIQDTYKGQQANVNIAVQNTSKEQAGMCVGCGNTSKTFAEANKTFNINIYQGTTGARP